MKPYSNMELNIIIKLVMYSFRWNWTLLKLDCVFFKFSHWSGFRIWCSRYSCVSRILMPHLMYSKRCCFWAKVSPYCLLLKASMDCGEKWVGMSGTPSDDEEDDSESSPDWLDGPALSSSLLYVYEFDFLSLFVFILSPICFLSFSSCYFFICLSFSLFSDESSL